MATKLTLYDLANQGSCACWSPNPWKTRLALNFKGLDYKTEWMEYPDIGSTLKALNVKPNSTSPPYTIPALRFPDGVILQDSRSIASKLEELQPSPTLHLDDPALPEIQAAVLASFASLRPIILPAIRTNLLSARSTEYFERTRAVTYGMSLTELGATKGGELAWKAAAEPLAELVRLIKGPFVRGTEVSYADFVVAGFLRCVLRAVGEEAWERVVGSEWDNERKLRGVYEGCEVWLSRDSH